ncbi:MAG: glycosyltransferase family 2 protein [Halobacteriaceae archaeon]
MASPSVAVVIPTYDRPQLLRTAVEAVLDQSHRPDEVILVDDGSGDEQRQYLRDLAEREALVEVIYQENRGPAAARNRGWRAADSDVVAFTDDDCRPPPNWLEAFVEGYREYPEVAGVGSWLAPPDEVAERNAFARFHTFLNREVYEFGDQPVVGGEEVPVGGTGSMSYRREVLAEMGGFDESFPAAAGEDADLKERVTAAGHQLLLVPVAVEHRQQYSLSQFVEESVRRGEGVHYFQRKHGTPRGPVRILAGLLAAPALGLADLRRTRDPRLVGLSIARRALGRAGELAAWLETRGGVEG